MKTTSLTIEATYGIIEIRSTDCVEIRFTPNHHGAKIDLMAGYAEWDGIDLFVRDELALEFTRVAVYGNPEARITHGDAAFLGARLSIFCQ